MSYTIPDPESSAPPRRRRWLRYYLVRAGLALALLINLGIVWIAIRAARQRAVVEPILNGGGFVQYNYPLINWRSSWWDADTTPGWLRFTHSVLDDNYFGDVVRAYVKTNAGLQRLNYLTELKSLTIDADQTNVNDHHVTDSGLTNLTELHSLESLWIWGNGVSDDGLKAVGRLRGLKDLDFNHSRVTNAGLAHLKDLRGLKHLGLLGADIDDAGLKHLEELTQLQSLILSGTKVSDAGLEFLKRFSQLRWLSITNTKVTDEGVQRFLQAMPNCKIVQ